jgi:hypothetical protein
MLIAYVHEAAHWANAGDLGLATKRNGRMRGIHRVLLLAVWMLTSIIATHGKPSRLVEKPLVLPGQVSRQCDLSHWVHAWCSC